ncbi:MAG TPA: Dyp-type peroxidase [Casimicrobiaceae bacterium]|jgi:putative iron-dependent peroxidase
MNDFQPGILAPIPLAARHLFFSIANPDGVRVSLKALRDVADGDATVVGLGHSLTLTLGANIEQLRVFPASSLHVDVPSTPAALWCWLRGDDRGDVVRRSMVIEHALRPHLVLAQAIDAFRYKTGLDLTGYEDGTENPRDAAALDAAILKNTGAGFDGSSFVAIQQWVHAFERFEAMAAHDQDLAIGRQRSDNEEIDDAPPFAHVKRTAQESFEPEAFVFRRSMPWNDERRAGLVFVAFGKSFDAFEAQLRRMTGAEDGIVDALFRFSRPVTGAYFWCPPLCEGRLDLRALGL